MVERSSARTAALLPAAPITPCTRDELEVLRAVCSVSLLRGAAGGVRRSELQAELGLKRRALHRRLQRLIHVGALQPVGRWPGRGVLITDAGLSTIAVAHGPLPVQATGLRRRTP